MSVYGLGSIASPAVPAAPTGPSPGAGRREEESLDPTFSAMLATLVGPRAAAAPPPPGGDKAPSGGPADKASASSFADKAPAGAVKTGGTPAAAAALLAALGVTATATGAGADAVDGAAFLAQLQAGLPADAQGLGLEQLQALLAAYGDEMPAELLALNGPTGQGAVAALAQGSEPASVATELMALLKAGAVTKAGNAGAAEAVTTGAQAAPTAAAQDAATTLETAPPAVPPAPPAADPAEAETPDGETALTAATPAAAKAAAPQTTRVAQAGETPGGQARAREDRSSDSDTGFDPAAQAAQMAGAAQPAGPTAATHEIRFLERIPNPVDPSRLIESLPKALAETGPGQYSMTLQLHPADLGAVRLQLHLSGNQVHAVMEVASPAARDALQSQSEQLRQGLTQSGLTLTGFEVSTGHSGSSPRDRQEQFAEAIGLERASSRPRPQATSRPVEPAEKPQPRRPGSRIDTLV